jgi:glycerol-3-phosphate acyltransferase PlsY
VATVTGVLFALDWQVTSLAIAVFFVVRFVTGQVFFGSLALGLTLVVGAGALHPENWLAARLPITVLCTALSVLLFWTHRSNLRKHFASRKASS